MHLCDEAPFSRLAAFEARTAQLSGKADPQRRLGYYSMTAVLRGLVVALEAPSHGGVCHGSPLNSWTPSGVSLLHEVCRALMSHWGVSRLSSGVLKYFEPTDSGTVASV